MYNPQKLLQSTSAVTTYQSISQFWISENCIAILKKSVLPEFIVQEGITDDFGMF